MLIILDRDGVINEDSDNYIRTPDEWIEIPRSLQTIAELNRLGHQVVIATNQSGVGRGFFSLDGLHAIHEKMNKSLANIGGRIDGIYFCPHHPSDLCECRKPKPGLLKQISKDFSTDLSQAIFIGDSLRDITAARNADCKAILVLTGKGEKTYAENPTELKDITVLPNLAALLDSKNLNVLSN